MKSLHINTQKGWGGGEQQTLYLLEGLRRRGDEVLLAARPESPLARACDRAGVPVLPVRPLNEGDPRVAWQLARCMRSWRPQVVHMHTPHAHLLGFLAGLLAPACPRVVTRRVEFSIYRKLTLGTNWLKYRFGAHHFIAVSAAVRHVLIRDGIPAERISVVHSGVDPARRGWSQPALSPAELRERLAREFDLEPRLPWVLQVGVIDANKGQDVVLRAAAAMPAARRAAFIFAGDGPRRREVEALARDLRLLDRVRFPGFRDDILDLTHASTVLVQASHIEGLGTALLDAMAIGTPVVATRVGGAVEVVDDGRTGLIVPPGEPAALAAALDRLLWSADLREQLAAAARKVVRERFSVETMVDGNVAVYRALVDRAATPAGGSADQADIL